MVKKLLSVLAVFVAAGTFCAAQTDSLSLQEVVVTGTRNATDVRHLPYTVNVISRQTLTEQQQTSILPTVMQQVPGLMVTSRSMMGYGVSTGAAGGISLRGLAGGAVPLQNRINRQHGTYIVDYAEQIGLGSSKYNLIDIQTSGIDGAQVTTSYRYNVYSLDGKKVLAGAASLDGLAKGTYIINGETRIIK